MPLITSEYVFSDDYPTIEPSLRLDFANARALDPRITFTRASTATYVGRDGLVKYAGEDEARFDHDPETLESLGLLIEESRTNYVENSIDFNAGDWAFNSGGTAPGIPVCTPNSGTAPDGSNTATRLVASTGGGSSNSDLSQIRSNRDNTSRAQVSVWMKSNTGADQNVWASGFDSPVVTTEWKRFTGGSTDWRIGARGDLSDENVDILIWGAQVEDGDKNTGFCTSYIPTSGSTVTRALEYGYTTNMDFYNQNEGSVLSEIKLLDYGSTSGKVIWSLNQAGGFGEGIYFVNENGSNNIKYSVQNNGSQFSGGIFNSNNFIKSAIGLKENSMINYYNGSLVGSEDTSGTIPNNIGRLVIGNNAWGSSDPSNGSNPSNGHMKSFSYYPKRLANAQLEALTQ